jgi:tRNA (guanine37-N1)-methyltransferase
VKFHVITIFPAFFAEAFREGVVGRAIASGQIELHIHNLRDWTHDRHQSVDDRPFGGGEGMLLKAEPLFQAVEQVLPLRGETTRVILLSAQGGLFRQADARRYQQYREIVLICGRYEGVDERVAQHLADEEVSIGDYVLSGGELGAAVILDAVGRLLPGVLGNEGSSINESFTEPALLDCPQYTRPANFRGWDVPDVLLSGNHAEIEKWRKKAAQEKTRRNRPDLLPSANE